MQSLDESSNNVSIESIRVLVKKFTQPNSFDCFHYISEDSIKTTDREYLLTWIVDVSSQLNLSVSTGLLACKYIDNFFNKKPNALLRILKLTGLVALSIAAKYKEGVEIDKKIITNILNDSFNVDAINTTECYILETLNWQIGLDTACDLIEAFLEYSFEDKLSLKFVNTCFAIAALCYCDTDIAKLGTYNISISSIIVSLGMMSFHKQKDEWIIFIEKNNFEIDKGKIEWIVYQIERKLMKIE